MAHRECASKPAVWGRMAFCGGLLTRLVQIVSMPAIWSIWRIDNPPQVGQPAPQVLSACNTGLARHGEQDFSGVSARFHQALRVDSLIERQDAIDNGAKPPEREMGPHPAVDGIAQHALFIHRPGAERGAGDDQALSHHQRQVGGDLAAVAIGDVHQPSAGGEHLQVLGEIISADHVEDHVHALSTRPAARSLNPILFLIMENAFAAEARSKI